MPLVAGRTLSKEIESRPTLALRLRLLPQLTGVAEAIAYSHEQGVLHRDLKPDNILIGAFGEAVVIDWGLAKELGSGDEEERPFAPREDGEPSDGLTALGVGTPQYMAPEQSRGEPPSPLLDIYGLGSTLYHLLCGEPPYGFRSARAVRVALHQGPPQALQERVPQAPPELVHLCERAMSREPSLRFASSREFAEELRRFQTGRLLESRRYTPAELLAHFVRRHRVLLSVVAGALLVVAVAGTAGVINLHRQRDRAEESLLSAARSLRKAQGVLASKLSAEAPRRLEAIALGVVAVGPELSSAELVAPSPEALQGLLDALVAGPAPLALKHGGAITDFAVSPDGSLLAGTGDDHTVLLWDARSGRRIASFTSKLATPHQVRFSPKGDRLAVCGNEPRAELHELQGGRRIEIQADGPMACEFAPDGTLLTAGEGLVLRDPHTGAALRTVALPTPVVRIAVSREGLVGLAGKDGSLRSWSIQTGALDLLSPAGAPATSLAFDSAGRQLVLVRRDEKVNVWVAHGAEFVPGMAVPPSEGHGYASRARFSPDGRWLAVPIWGEEETLTSVFETGSGALVSSASVFAQEWAGEDLFLADAHGTFSVLDAHNGRTALALVGQTEEVKAAAWLGDGAASASRDGEEYLWDLRPGVASGLLLGHSSEVTAASLNPARTHLLTSALDGSVRIWPLPDGAPAKVFPGRSAVTAVTWSPDGLSALASCLDGSVRLIDLRTGRDTETFRAGGPISVARFFGDGQRAVVGSLDGQLAVVSLSGAGPPHRLGGAGQSAVTAAAVSPSGLELASAHADGSVRVWATASGLLLARRSPLPPDEDGGRAGVLSLVYSTADRLLLGAAGGTTSLVEAHTLAPLGSLPGRAAGAAAWPLSPDGRLFAAAAPDGRVLLHDLESGKSTPLPGDQGIVLSTAFSDDGKLLATGGLSGSLRLFEVATGRALLEQNARLGPVTAVAFTANSQWVIAGYGNGALRVHPGSPAAALARGCSILRRFEQLGDAEGYCESSRTETSRKDMNDR